jgi:excisionase family DNA binding protein
VSCSVYRFYAADGRLLYVGITSSASSRLAQHAGDKDWFPEVARATFEHHATREDALAAEREAIVAERPVHNLRHSPTRGPSLRRGEMTVDQAAEYLRVDTDSITRWVNFGRIPHRRRSDGTLVFRRRAIDEWLSSLRNREAAS